MGASACKEFSRLTRPVQALRCPLLTGDAPYKLIPSFLFSSQGMHLTDKPGLSILPPPPTARILGKRSRQTILTGAGNSGNTHGWGALHSVAQHL